MRGPMARCSLALALLVVSPLCAGGDPAAWANAEPERPRLLLVRNATIWTSGPAGRLEGADLLIRDGKIAEVGRGLAVPPRAQVIDATGRHLTPGLIDAHSHAAIVGNVNEATHISTAEVRVADVINSESIHLYWQLAGGVTTIHLLHGSANAIGGQNAVIKLRWGAPPEKLLVDGAPPGIKFALGENPKQSNWNPRERRYPQTRMGVERVIRERFAAAREAGRLAEERTRRPRADQVPVRRDLELEALQEILAGRRLVHAHSYRADEILMMLRLAEEFGFRIATLQHALEAYKVAPEVARHGAGVSNFSDWWAFKYEVIDAIPYAPAIAWRAGALVSLNSDDAELARRLNLEAAKAVRYGGVPEEEALQFVTSNPARQLGLAARIGSLEAGKDADFVIWSGHPLSAYSRVEQTWVDGRKYFDREADLAGRDALAAEREALLAKLAADPRKAEADEPPAAAPSYYLWESNFDGFCWAHDHKERP